MIAVAGLFLAPQLPIENNLQLRIVESGSMEPAIMTGSLVIVVPSKQYAVGDVITFESRSADIPTSHRVVDTYEERGRTWFITKGDANEEADTTAVPIGDVIGKVFVAIPNAGYVLDFARQPLGFALLIMLPAFLIVFGELEKIWIEIRRKRKGESDTTPTEHRPDPEPVVASTLSQPVRKITKPMMDIATPVRYQFSYTLDLRNMSVTFSRRTSEGSGRFGNVVSAIGVLLFSIGIATSLTIPSTLSYFGDTEMAEDNTMSAVLLDFTAIGDSSSYTLQDGVMIGDDDGFHTTTLTPVDGSVSVLYDVSVEKTGGNSAFCDAIYAESDDPFSYYGPLPLMSEPDVDFVAPWLLEFTILDDTGFVDDEQCMLDLVFTAFHFEETTNTGYFDEERVPLSFTFSVPPAATQQFNLAPQTLGVSISNEMKDEDVEENKLEEIGDDDDVEDTEDVENVEAVEKEVPGGDVDDVDGEEAIEDTKQDEVEEGGENDDDMEDIEDTEDKEPSEDGVEEEE